MISADAILICDPPFTHTNTKRFVHVCMLQCARRVKLFGVFCTFLIISSHKKSRDCCVGEEIFHGFCKIDGFKTVCTWLENFEQHNGSLQICEHRAVTMTPRGMCAHCIRTHTQNAMRKIVALD